MGNEQIPVAKPANEAAPQQQPASTRAISALVLGILAVLCMGLLTGIPAIIMGSMELKAIRAGLAPKTGEGMAKTGYILGIVGTVFSLLAIAVVIAMIVLGITLSSSGFFNNLTTSTT